MAALPSNVKTIAYFLKRLPGIGEKTANRLAFYFLRLPDADLELFAQSVSDLKKKTKFCTVCKNLTEDEVCFVCADTTRDKSIVTVVEDALDLLSFETGNIYRGGYHVLHGKIDPLNNIGPDDIYIDSFISRVRGDDTIKEIILATNLDMEGEATAMYIKEKLNGSAGRIKITRLAYGLPMGASLEYADYMTLKRAIEGRTDM